MADTNCPTLPDVVAVDTSIDTILRLRDDGVADIIRCGVPCLDTCPSYEEFFSQFLLPNKPCLLSSTATLNWRSRREWVCQDGKPNFEFLQQHFGEAVVPVANCDEEEFCAHPKQEMLLKDFLQYWMGSEAEGEPAGDRCLYLKDWHFSRSFADYCAYETPTFFQSDWLNEFWDTQADKTDDYKFVYMGPKHSWTPLHADVMRSYSWSANICGRKKWILFPPGEEDALKDKFGQLVFDITSSDLHNPSTYPDFSQLQHQLEVIQEAGEIIFVPSGWHHQVVNLEDTISVNHNWLNGCNIDICWQFIRDSLKDVKIEISDCRSMEGWHQQCQLILKSTAGIDYAEFYTLLLLIARHRLKSIGCLENSIVEDPPSLAGKCSCDVDTVNYTTDDKKKNDLDTVYSANVWPLSDKKNREDDVVDSSAESTLSSRKDQCDDESINTTFHTSSTSTDKSADRTQRRHRCLDLLRGLSEEADMNHHKLLGMHWRFCDTRHAFFDLNRVKHIVLEMLQDEDWAQLDTSPLLIPPQTLLDEIESISTKHQMRT